MPMIDDVAEPLVSKPQDSGRAGDAAAGFVEGAAYQLAFTLVDLFFKGASKAGSLGLGNRGIRDRKSGASTQTQRGFRIQLVS